MVIYFARPPLFIVGYFGLYGYRCFLAFVCDSTVHFTVVSCVIHIYMLALGFMPCNTLLLIKLDIIAGILLVSGPIHRQPACRPYGLRCASTKATISPSRAARMRTNRSLIRAVYAVVHT